MALLAAFFTAAMPSYTNWRRGSGTPTKHTRTPGKRRISGWKLARMAREHRLDCSNIGGMVSEAIRNDKINRNLARFANEDPDNNIPVPESNPNPNQEIKGW